MIRVCFLSILMRIICSCDPSGHLVSRQELDFIPRSALLSSLDRGYRCFSPVGAVNGARKVCSDDIGERTFFVVDGSVPQRGTRMGSPAQARNERSTGFLCRTPLATKCPERAHEHSMRNNKTLFIHGLLHLSHYSEIFSHWDFLFLTDLHWSTQMRNHHRWSALRELFVSWSISPPLSFWRGDGGWGRSSVSNTQARNERSTGFYVVHLWQRSAPKGHTSILCAIIKRYLSTDFCTWAYISLFM